MLGFPFMTWNVARLGRAGRAALAAALVAVLATLSACEEENREPVRVGVVLPLTGEYQIYGVAGLRGIEMAIGEANAEGGVLGGRRLELVVADNRTDPSRSIREARRLIQKETVVALFGPVSSASRQGMALEAARSGIPLLYGIDYEGGHFDPFLFCYSTIPDHYVKPVVPILMQEHGPAAYLFGYDYVWPHEIAAAVARELTARGGRVAGQEFTPFGVEDFTPVLERIERSGADVLYLIQPGSDGFRFLRQFRERGLAERVKVFAFAADESYLDAVPAEDLEGVATALHFFGSVDNQVVRDFVSRYQLIYGAGRVPTYATWAHYALARILVEAIRVSGSTRSTDVVAAMETGMAGLPAEIMRPRADHHFDLPMYLAEYRGGRLQVRVEFGVISPADQRSGSR